MFGILYTEYGDSCDGFPRIIDAAFNNKIEAVEHMHKIAKEELKRLEENGINTATIDEANYFDNVVIDDCDTTYMTMCVVELPKEFCIKIKQENKYE